MHDDVREKFVRDGFLFPVKFLSPEETGFYAKKYQEYVRKYGSKGTDGRQRIRGNRIFRLHVLADWAYRLVTHPGLIAKVKQVLNSDNILIWSSDITCKPNRSTECFGWHQDEAYALLGPHEKLVTAWIALTKTNPSNGCVRFIKASNNLGQLDHTSQERRTQDQNLVLGQIIADNNLIQELESQVVNCELNAGEASLHAWRTIHSSKPNSSDQDRVGLAVRYMSGDVEPIHKPAVVRELVTLAAGQYTGQYFDIEDVPKGEFGKEEWAIHRKSMEREWERRRKCREKGLIPSQQYDKEKGLIPSQQYDEDKGLIPGQHNVEEKGDRQSDAPEEKPLMDESCQTTR